MQEILIKGYCYPPNSSDRKRSELVFTHDSYELIIESVVVKTGNLHDLKFSDRIGSINRKVFFPSGTQFETPDNDSIDELLGNTRHKNHSASAVNRLESSWTMAIAAVFCTGLLVAGFFKFGLPAAANYAAHKIPVSASENISEGTLELLSGFLFDESKVAENKQAEITSRFERYLALISNTGGFTYTLHFFDMKGIANAFALPGGDIVVTDALVELTTDLELDSILFHEIGHVVERHGLESVIKASTMAVIVTVALGDLSTVAELTTGSATFMLQSSYSREAESEADDYSLLLMEQLEIDPIHFATAMRKLSSQSGRVDKEEKNYFSSHPATGSRIEKAEQRSKAFNSR